MSIKNVFSRVAITTGDENGIGFEVTAKSLFKIGPQPKTSFFVFRDHKQEKIQGRYFKLIDKKFDRLTFESAQAALSFFSILEITGHLNSKFIFDIASKDRPVEWFMQATQFCKKNLFSSLVTGPLSKTSIHSAGYRFVGHTGYFRELFPRQKFFMGFVGSRFNVLLATDHDAIAKVEKILTPSYLKTYFSACKVFKSLCSSISTSTSVHKSSNARTRSNKNLQIALLGLNPHAGEKGVISSFEKRILIPQIKKSFAARDYVGPLSPDAAFLNYKNSTYSFFACLYHDQGLIPFKMVHGQDSGVHVTIGLPFLRTSVDHGTAFDIFNKNVANEKSMTEAIEFNLKFLQKKTKLASQS